MTPSNNTGGLEARLDEVARLLTLLLSRDRPLQQTIAELGKVGFGPVRIAELLGTTPGYAKVALARAKQRNAEKKTQGHE